MAIKNLKKSSTKYINIATDGAITKKIKSAGVGVVLQYVDQGKVLEEARYWQNITNDNVTSQIAELTAIEQSPELVAGFIEYINETYNANYEHDTLNINLYSDSAYCINCFEGVNGSKPWFINWMKNGWVTNTGNNVSNKELWQSLLAQINNTFLLCMSEKLNRNSVDEISKEIINQSQTSKITFNFIKVKGHSGHELNEIADKLAVEAKQMEANTEKFVLV